LFDYKHVFSASLALLVADLKDLFVTGSLLISTVFFFRSFLIEFEYRTFSENSPKPLFKEILLILVWFQLLLELSTLYPGIANKGGLFKKYFVARMYKHMAAELPRFISLYLLVLAELRWSKGTGSLKKNTNK